jgi:hypothetical protein
MPERIASLVIRVRVCGQSGSIVRGGGNGLAGEVVGEMMGASLLG